jgi:hypothetical protein
VKTPRWVPPLVFGLATIVLFAGFIFSSDFLFGTDTQSLGYMARAFYANALKTEGFPLWNPYILGGTPFIEALSGGDSLYPLSAPLLLIMEPYRALGWKLVLHVFLAGVFMYGWIRTLGLSRASATIAGLAFAMAPYMVSLVYNGQDGKIFVTALTPLAFMAADRALTRRRVHDFAGLALVVGLVILTTHFQLAYFLFGALGAFASFRTIQAWRVHEGGGSGAAMKGRQAALGAFSGFVLASLLGAGVAAVQLLPAADYVTKSSRRTATTVEARSDDFQRAYSSSYSLHPEEILGIAVPEFVGGSTGQGEWLTNTYWGRNFFKTNSDHIGLLVLLLAGLSFLGAPSRGLRYFFSCLGGVALLFALGEHTPVWGLFYRFVPGIGLFRAPSLMIFLVGFSVTTLAAFGIERLIDLGEGTDGAEVWKGPTWYSLTVVGVLTLLLLSAASGGLSSFWTTVVWPDITSASFGAMGILQPHMVRGVGIAVAIAMAFAAVIWILSEHKLPLPTVIVILGVILAADLYRIDSDYIVTADWAPYTRAGALIDRVVEEQDPQNPQRLFSMVAQAQDVRPGQFGVELAGGHHPNDLARYRELIGMEGSGLPQYLPGSDRLFDILNIGWMLWPAYQYNPIEDLDVAPEVLSKLERASGTQRADGTLVEILYRVNTLPRARLVNRVDVIPEENAVEHILVGDFDPETEVVLNAAPPIALTGDSLVGSVTWVERKNNRHVIDVEASSAALLVVADNWYPAWKATVDGNPAPVLRANHTLRAVPVPAGRHEVVFEYRSDLLVRSLWTSIVSLLLVCGVGVTSLLRSRRSIAPNEADAAS